MALPLSSYLINMMYIFNALLFISMMDVFHTLLFINVVDVLKYDTAYKI